MAGKTKRAALLLTPDQETMLRRLAGSRTAAVREVERATVLLGYAEGSRITDLQGRNGVTGPASYRCTSPAPAAGVRSGREDPATRAPAAGRVETGASRPVSR